MDRQTFFLENLRKYHTVAELNKSEFFAECRGEVERILATPQTYFDQKAAPLLCSFVRIVQWNIEKGRRFDAILEQLKNDDILRWADVILLNEADCGMNRSGNRHVAQCLADALGMNMAFAPAHFELTKGVGEELDLAGENKESLQGNAVLSRYPILECCITPLPNCFEPYEFSEKRYGRRNCIWARLQLGTRSLWAGAVHLEVRNTPQCRAKTHSCSNRLPKCRLHHLWPAAVPAGV
jgi:endonuclease/exonuclease/phosphatase family metal-dependent hydrolase